MPTLEAGSRAIDGMFELLGTDEDAITAAIAWTLKESPSLLRAFLQQVCGYVGDVDDAVIHCQRHERHAGRTDIEILVPAAVHVIVEAKRGWSMPSHAQLEQYARRLSFGTAGETRAIVTLSEADRRFATSTCATPAAVLGIPVTHFSRRELLALFMAASPSRRRERARLQELAGYLNKTMAKPNFDSNVVFVVSLSRKPVSATWPGVSFLDVVLRYSRYFHPIAGKWPKTPPNYIGFRYDGALRSIHHIVKTTITRDLAAITEPGILAALPVDPHFIYELGPAIVPPRPMPNGQGVSRSMHVRAAIDLLLTAASIAEARKLTSTRAQ